jgi:PAS domain S-box-containing protein
MFYIKKLKMQRDELQQSEQILKTIINGLPDLIGYKDSEGKWIVANEAFFKIFNTDETMLGKTNLELMFFLPEFKKELEGCEETDKKTWENKNTSMFEESFHQLDGTFRTFDVVKVPIFYDYGNRKGVAVLGREITERKKTEELKKQTEDKERQLLELKHYNEIRTEFFANLSHELRTPLNLIMSSVQLIQKLNENEINCLNKFNKYINIIRQNSYRLVKIVNNLIDITKIEAGYLEPNFYNVNIVEIVENITLSINSYAEQKEISLIFDTNVEEKVMSCDPYIIERIMLNLLSNAVKFTQNGGTIEVFLEDNNDFIEIIVKDNGIGIPIEKQSLIFERFVQVDKSLSRNREGSGIGLSLVKAFVEIHGGKIEIDNDYTEGSKFIVCIPVRVLAEVETEHNNYICQNKDNRVQIINVEFSDIYS